MITVDELHEIKRFLNDIIHDRNCIAILFHKIVDFYFLSEKISLEIAKKDLSNIINYDFRSQFEIFAVDRGGNEERWNVSIKIFSIDEFSSINFNDLPNINNRSLIYYFYIRNYFKLVTTDGPLKKNLHFKSFQNNNVINVEILKKEEKQFKKIMFNNLFNLLEGLFKYDKLYEIRIKPLIDFCKQIIK